MEETQLFFIVTFDGDVCVAFSCDFGVEVNELCTI